MRNQYLNISSKRVQDCIVRKYTELLISYKLEKVINLNQKQQGP